MSDQFKLSPAFGAALDFDVWDGPPPPPPQKKFNTITKAGVDGASKHYLGVIPDAFSAQLTKYAITEELARLYAYSSWPLAVGKSYSLTYEGDDITGRTGYLFFLDEVELKSLEAATLIVTPDETMTSGFVLTAKFTLTPVKY